MTGKEVRAGDLLPVVADRAHLIYSKIVENSCVRLKGTTTLKELEMDGAVDEDTAASIVLQEAGILKKGSVLSHTKTSGRERYRLSDVLIGTESLIRNTYAVVLTDGIKYRNLPSEYKKAGIVYVYNDVIAISAGDDKIYSLGMSFISKLLGGYYTKYLFSTGRLFVNPILAVIVPLDEIKPVEVKTENVKKEEEKQNREADEFKEYTEKPEEKNETEIEEIKQDLDIHKTEAKEEPVGASKKATKRKSITVIAKEVIAGKWGNDKERKNRLTKAGYDYNKVQKKVNELLKKRKSVDVIAQEVIDGKWGTAKTRKTKLEQAGYDYKAVQKKVNELLKCNWSKFEKSLKDTALDLKKRGVKYLNKGTTAGNIKDTTNCAGYVQEALYNIGCFPKGESFYLSKDVHGSKKALEYISKNFKVMHSKKVWDKASLKPGDICGFDWGDGVHTMVYAGTEEKNGEKYPVWYTYGSATPFSDIPVRKKSYEKRTVYVKIRHKDLAV